MPNLQQYNIMILIMVVIIYKWNTKSIILKLFSSQVKDSPDNNIPILYINCKIVRHHTP